MPSKRSQHPSVDDLSAEGPPTTNQEVDMGLFEDRGKDATNAAAATRADQRTGNQQSLADAAKRVGNQAASNAEHEADRLRRIYGNK